MMSVLPVCYENSCLSGGGSPNLTEAAEMVWNGVNAVWKGLCCQLSAAISSVQAIRLDFSAFVTDTHYITPVPPLPLVGDVHLGRVFLCPDGISIRQGGRHE